MTRKARFRAADITRAVKAFQQTGHEVEAIEIAPDGTITVRALNSGARRVGDNPLDRLFQTDEEQRTDWFKGSPLFERDRK
jgi:hypothetical protein